MKASFTVFYYFADSEAAEQIATHGFEHSGVWTPESTVSLLDRVPEGIGGAVLRVSDTRERAGGAPL